MVPCCVFAQRLPWPPPWTTGPSGQDPCSAFCRVEPGWLGEGGRLSQPSPGLSCRGHVPEFRAWDCALWREDASGLWGPGGRSKPTLRSGEKSLPLECGLDGVRARGAGSGWGLIVEEGGQLLSGGPGPSRSPPTHREACFWFWFCGCLGVGSIWRVVPQGRGAGLEQPWAPFCTPLSLQGTSSGPPHCPRGRGSFRELGFRCFLRTEP